MTRLAMVAAALCVAPAAFTEVAAQDTAHGVIIGKVVGTNSTPVPAAVVTLDSSRVQVMTDSAGAFTLREVVTGRHTLTARRLGFAIASVLTTVTASESTAVVLRLEPAPQMLPEVEVRGLKVTDLPRFTAAVDRASRNNGAAFTADGIAKENPFDTKSLLERLPGVHVTIAASCSRVVRTAARCRIPTPAAAAGAEAVRSAPPVAQLRAFRFTSTESV